MRQVLFVIWTVMTLAVTADSFNGVDYTTSGAVVQGKFTSQYAKAEAYADKYAVGYAGPIKKYAEGSDADDEGLHQHGDLHRPEAGVRCEEGHGYVRCLELTWTGDRIELK